MKVTIRPVVAVLTAVAAASMAVAACSSPSAPVPATTAPAAATTTRASAKPTAAMLPVCSIGHGSDGSTASLTISQQGTTFTGTYLVTPPGLASGTALQYAVTGTTSNGRLFSEWTLGSVALRVTGSYTAQVITLDNPGHKFSVTVFRSSTGCA